MKILGITFASNNKNIMHVNFEPKVSQIEKQISHCRMRNLTTLGCITIVKSILMSKLVHLFTTLPNLSPEELKRLERLLFNFIWAGKRDPIKRAKLIQDYSLGGLRMVDVSAFEKSMKLTLLKRLATSKARWSEIIATEIPGIQDTLFYGSRYLERITEKINNIFWKDVLGAFACFSRSYNPDIPGMLSESLWFSDNTKFHRSIISSWYLKGIRFIGDLFNENTGILHTKETLEHA